jgi:acetyl-CoA carboxylase biotin carboxyl carrier protein
MARKARARPPAAGVAWTPQQIVELAVTHDLTELEIESMGLRVRVVRGRLPAAPPAPHVAAPVTLPQTEGTGQPTELSPGTVSIDAPMVGTFYRATSPDAAPFVSEGDIVKEGQTLCIIEAMKLMNEIESKVSGRVVKILVENAQPVEFGQHLFLVEPRR